MSDAEGPDEIARVSTLELFFDLVFVFAVTQLASILVEHPSWTGTAQGLVELMVVYWMYGGYAWLTNGIGAGSASRRLAVMLGMAAFLVVSLAVPRAFGADALVFGYAYLLLTVLHLGSFVIFSPTVTLRGLGSLAGANLVAAGLVLAAGYVHGAAHWPLWVAAVLVQWGPPTIGGTVGAFTIGVEHFAERHALMILIVLGESLVSVAAAAQSHAVSAHLIIGALAGLAASAAMWWAYFDGEDDAGAEALGRRPAERRGLAALVGYDLTHVLMMAGVVGVAAGSRLCLPDLTRAGPLAAAWFIAGGASLFVAALAGFRAVLGSGQPLPRVVGALALLAVVPLCTHVSAAAELIAVAVLIVAVLAAEHLTGKAR